MLQNSSEYTYSQTAVIGQSFSKLHMKSEVTRTFQPHCGMRFFTQQRPKNIATPLTESNVRAAKHARSMAPLIVTLEKKNRTFSIGATLNGAICSALLCHNLRCENTVLNADALFAISEGAINRRTLRLEVVFVFHITNSSKRHGRHPLFE